jgi:hypothetical protein
MGKGWRHSYQYALDISNAPLGEVLLSLPDGSRHSFTRSGNQFRSSSLLSWTLEASDSLQWQAFTTEGMIYRFDAAGRLQRISDYLGHALLFSPIPLNYLGDYAGGFFVTDDYDEPQEPGGRRIEKIEIGRWHVCSLHYDDAHGWGERRT